MVKKSIATRVFHFYRDGFRSMTLGRTLWLIIFIKLFIMFAVLRVFFFPSFLGKFDNPSDKQDYVSGELIQRAINP
jgi:uncharacterized membrane protein